MKYLLSLSLLFFSFNFSAQCKGIAKECKKNLGDGYMPTGQSSNTELFQEKNINLLLLFTVAKTIEFLLVQILH